MPLEKTIYEVNGILANLQSYEEVIFNIPEVKEVTSQKYNRYINLLTQLVHTLGKMTDDYKCNPWNSANVPSVSNELRHDIGAYLSRLLPKVDKAIRLINTLEQELEIQGFNSFEAFKTMPEILDMASQSPIVPIGWVTDNDLAELFNEIDEYSGLKSSYIDTKEKIHSLFETKIGRAHV